MISGTGAYAGGISFPIHIVIDNSTTLTVVGGTVMVGVASLSVQALSTFSIPGRTSPS
jgi:hypothetical protein